MVEIANQIESNLNSDFIDLEFPVLTQHGLQDADVFIHSVGCSVWNLLGQQLDYMAIAEAPAPTAGGNDIRSDSVWFEKTSNNPSVLVEFERYDGTQRGKLKLQEKLTNLMEAAMRWNNRPVLLVLSAWSPGLVSAPDFKELGEVFLSGSHNSKGSAIPRPQNCNLLFHRMILEKCDDMMLRLKHMMFQLQN